LNNKQQSKGGHFFEMRAILLIVMDVVIDTVTWYRGDNLLIYLDLKYILLKVNKINKLQKEMEIGL